MKWEDEAYSRKDDDGVPVSLVSLLSLYPCVLWDVI